MNDFNKEHWKNAMSVDWFILERLQRIGVTLFIS